MLSIIILFAILFIIAVPTAICVSAFIMTTLDPTLKYKSAISVVMTTIRIS